MAQGGVVIRNVRLAEDSIGGPPAGTPAAVYFCGGGVADVVSLDSLPASFGAATQTIDGGGLWLLPGWVDIQVNDLEWLACGLKSPAQHAERIRQVIEYQVARGVTGFTLATLASPEEEILAYLSGMKIIRDGSASNGGKRESAFLGGLVEGTFMNPAFHGAHNPEYVLPPDVALLDRFVDTGAVRLLNVAPEVSEQALEVIAHALRRGVVVGVGHAKPNAERVREAVSAGLRYVIHLGNGPTGTSLRGLHGGGLLEEALSNDGLIATIIVDGVHINGRLVRDYLERKGVERTIAVSDAGFACGNPEGEFEVFGIRGRVSDDRTFLAVVPQEDAEPFNPFASDAVRLFGSAADMRTIFETTLNLLTVELQGVYYRRHAALELPNALGVATKLCATNPARLLAEPDRGTLRKGSRADASLVEITGAPGEHRVRVERVWLAGQ